MIVIVILMNFQYFLIFTDEILLGPIVLPKSPGCLVCSPGTLGVVEDTGMALVAATEHWSISKRTRVDLAIVRENQPKKWREKLGSMTSLYHFPICLPTKLRILHDFT